MRPRSTSSVWRMDRSAAVILHTEELDRVRIAFHCFPEDWEGHDTGLPTAKLYPDLVQRDEARKVSRAIKRATDVLGSALALVLLSPIFLAIAVAIKLSSPGPILFRQKRIGQYGVPFACLKFRTMHAVNNAQIHMDYVKRFIAGKVDPGVSGTNGGAVYKIT